MSTFAIPLRNGSIAQLVQSVCLTSRGSGVRLPLLPQVLRNFVCLSERGYAGQRRLKSQCEFLFILRWMQGGQVPKEGVT